MGFVLAFQNDGIQSDSLKTRGDSAVYASQHAAKVPGTSQLAKAFFIEGIEADVDSRNAAAF